MSKMTVEELREKKKELEIRLSTYVMNELIRFNDETGVIVREVKVPIKEVFELGKQYPTYIIEDIIVTLEV